MKDRSLISITLFLFLTNSALVTQARVVPNGVFTDNMVLQRQQNVLIYGTTDEGDIVTVEFNGQRQATRTKDGKWQVSLDPMEHGGPSQLDIKSTNTNERITFDNVLVGDVWILTGQSNMSRPFRVYSPLMAELHDVQKNDNIRWFVIATGTFAAEPSKTIVSTKLFDNSWQASSPKLLPLFSPTGYFFGLHRYAHNKIPLGLILAARGASTADSWVPKEVLQNRSEYAWSLNPRNRRNGLSRDGEISGSRPTALYNGSICPLMPFSIKGALWYQGEGNVGEPETYRLLFPDLIRAWRKNWGQGDFPFLFAQLSSYGKSRVEWGWIREAQTFALGEPNTGMIVTHDIGEWDDIHPGDKNNVGLRFAQLAQRMEAREDHETLCAGCKIDGSSVLISFDNVQGGLRTKEVRMNRTRDLAPGTDPEAFVASADTVHGFTICSIDKVFHDAEARIIGDELVVSSPEVKQPVAVRYAWGTFTRGNLYNGKDLPLAGFRTDSFPRNY